MFKWCTEKCAADDTHVDTLNPPRLISVINTPTMSVSTLLIEGSFPELAEELAQYLDGLSEGAGVVNSIESELNQIREIESQETPDTSSIPKLRDDVLKKIITKATILNAAPERGRDRCCEEEVLD